MKNTMLLFLFALNVYSQNKMKPIEQLINTEDPGWKLVQEWIATAKNKVEVVPVNALKAKDALYKVQVTTRSPMGAVVYNTVGILIDGGWIRILGSGSDRLKRTLPDWNKGKAFKDFGEGAAFFLIADDAAGGFFLLNGSLPGKDPGKYITWRPIHSSMKLWIWDILISWLFALVAIWLNFMRGCGGTIGRKI
jgi:hypothetical protein